MPGMVTATDDEGSETIRIERALLKRNADGSAWWLLRYSAEVEGDDSESYEVRYEWWISSEVPGELVKYVWANTSDGTSLSGVLVSNQKGYTTMLGSF